VRRRSLARRYWRSFLDADAPISILEREHHQPEYGLGRRYLANLLGIPLRADEPRPAVTPRANAHQEAANQPDVGTVAVEASTPPPKGVHRALVDRDQSGGAPDAGTSDGPAHDGPHQGGAPDKAGRVRDAIRVLIVDDHGLFRRGLEATLQLEADIDVVGEAGDGGDALAKAQELLPDVVLMDVKMPRRGGIEACMSIKQAVPSARIVMLTMSDDEADLYEAVKAGASGYLLKEIPVDELAGSIRAVYEGQSLINPSLASKLLTEFATMSKRGVSPQSVPAPRLTNREMEVLRAVARGLNNREIAKELFISENTVKNHIRNILEKLQLHSRMEAVTYAMRTGLRSAIQVDPHKP
jgi:DNA-binding NarL/FixJ family response regulator